MTAPGAGTRGPGHPPPPTRGDGALLVGFATLLLVAALSSLLTFVALQVQAAATNYISAESLWTRSRAEATQALYAYAVTGETPELRRARDALAVPLTFNAARQALEASPSDRAAARALLEQAGVAPENTGRMVYLYPVFARVPVMRDGIAAWREADAAIGRLAEIANELEAAWAAGGDPETLLPLRREVAVANATLRPLESTFTRSLVVGSQRLRTTLLGTTVASYLLVALIAAALIGRAQRRLQLSERNLRATYEQAGVGMVRMDRTGRLVDANDAFCDLLGCTREGVREMTLADVLHEEDLPTHGRPLALAAAAEGGGAVERRFVRSDGSTMWGRVTVSPVELGGKAGTHLFMIVEDVTEAHRLSQELDYRARHDALTGLINRFEIEHRLQAALASGSRHGDAHTLCFMDLDQFKIVNDTSGHDAGDHLLRQVASLLKRSVRANDTVGRLGGDEFAIVLDRADASEARRVVEGLRQVLAEHRFRWDDRVYDVTCSIGYVEITGGEEDPGAWLRKADIACYLAKEAGRNRVHAYVEGDEALVERQGQMAWVGRIRDAIAHDRLTLLAQRIVATRGGGGAPTYELLLRIVDAEGRRHGPEAFMPAAERFGLVPELDRWVVDAALGTLARHPRHLSALGRCHVNLSAQAISDEAFCRFLLERLDAHDVPGPKLCFEITETAAIRSVADALTLIDALRARGCQVALDDFGTGLSSFAHLKSLPVDLVKIDGLFVRDIVASELDRAIVRSIHQVTRVLGRATIAEFVEDDAIRDVLTDIGIDHLQGVAIHAPVPWEEVLART